MLRIEILDRKIRKSDSVFNTWAFSNTNFVKLDFVEPVCVAIVIHISFFWLSLFKAI